MALALISAAIALRPLESVAGKRVWHQEPGLSIIYLHDAAFNSFAHCLFVKFHLKSPLSADTTIEKEKKDKEKTDSSKEAQSPDRVLKTSQTTTAVSFTIGFLARVRQQTVRGDGSKNQCRCFNVCHIFLIFVLSFFFLSLFAFLFFLCCL